MNLMYHLPVDLPQARSESEKQFALSWQRHTRQLAINPYRLRALGPRKSQLLEAGASGRSWQSISHKDSETQFVATKSKRHGERENAPFQAQLPS